MGTRSLTYVLDSTNRPIVTIYRQYDGYPEGNYGLGHEHWEFLIGRLLVNGFSLDDDRKISNGIDELAAQLVVNMKGDKKGNVYLQPMMTSKLNRESSFNQIVRACAKQTRECWGTYAYIICRMDNTDDLRITVIDPGWGEKAKAKVLFDGTPEEMGEHFGYSKTEEQQTTTSGRRLRLRSAS